MFCCKFTSILYFVFIFHISKQQYSLNCICLNINVPFSTWGHLYCTYRSNPFTYNVDYMLWLLYWNLFFFFFKQGIYVLQDNKFRLLTQISAGKQYLEHAPKVHFSFTLGTYQFNLNSLGLLIITLNFVIEWIQTLQKGSSYLVSKNCVFRNASCFIFMDLIYASRNTVMQFAAVMFALLDGSNWYVTVGHCHTNLSFLFGKHVLSGAFLNFPKHIWKMLFVTEDKLLRWYEHSERCSTK